MIARPASRDMPVDNDLHALHRRAADWLIRLREEPDDRTTADAFEAWLDQEPAHVRAWASVSAMFEAIGETRPEHADAWRTKDVPASRTPARRVYRRWGQAPRARAPGRRQLGAAVAAALLCAWIAPSAILFARADHMTGTGEMELVTLDDGSAVRLGPNSAIAVDYQAGARTVRLLAGQAWFDVKHNPGAPFRVAAGDVRTTVLGTSFDVRRIGSTTAVSVQRGRVRVVDHGAAPAPARELATGEWARLDARHRMSHGTDNPELLGAWREGQLIVRNRPVGEVIDELRPWYRGRIIVLSPALKDRRIDGVFDARDAMTALTAIVRQEGGSVRRLTPWLIVIS